MTQTETPEQEIKRLKEELEAAVIYARTESDRAKSAEHWRKIAEDQNSRGNTLKSEIYEVLKSEGYNIRSYSEVCLPRSVKEVIPGSKYAPGEFHVLGAVKHLIERAKKAERSNADTR